MIELLQNYFPILCQFPRFAIIAGLIALASLTCWYFSRSKEWLLCGLAAALYAVPFVMHW